MGLDFIYFFSQDVNIMGVDLPWKASRQGGKRNGVNEMGVTPPFRLPVEGGMVGGMGDGVWRRVGGGLGGGGRGLGWGEG